MTAPRRGIDRIKLNRLKSTLATRQEELRSHKQVCSQCHINDALPFKSCDEGWRIYKEIMRAGNNLATYVGVLPAKPLPGQGTLF